MTPLIKHKLFSETSGALKSGNCAKFRCLVEDLNKLADCSKGKKDKIEIVDRLILIAEHFAEKGLYEQAVATSKIAATHAPVRGEQEERIVMNILKYADRISFPLGKKEACMIALGFVDAHSPLEERVYQKLGEITGKIFLKVFSQGAATALHL